MFTVTHYEELIKETISLGSPVHNADQSFLVALLFNARKIIVNVLLLSVSLYNTGKIVMDDELCGFGYGAWAYKQSL